MYALDCKYLTNKLLISSLNHSDNYCSVSVCALSRAGNILK